MSHFPSSSLATPVRVLGGEAALCLEVGDVQSGVGQSVLQAGEFPFQLGVTLLVAPFDVVCRRLGGHCRGRGGVGRRHLLEEPI